MKIARVQVNGQESIAVIEGEQAHLVGGTIFEPGERTGVSLPLSAVQFLVPTSPTKIVAIGVNYRDHAGERPVPAAPQPFLKSPSSLIAQGEAIRLPADANNAHLEAEVVAVISKQARDLDEPDVDAHVLGYTAGNDVSERDWQQADLQWWRAKSSDTFTSVGPWIDTDLNPENIQLAGLINGKEQQAANTDTLVHSIRACIARVSRYMTLEPGDLVYTGTPGTTSRIQAGDTCEVQVADMVLSNPVTAR